MRRIAAANAAIQRQWKRLASSPRFAAIRAKHPRAWAFVAARFARGGYLGLHLTIGFTISVLALWLFAGVTEDVVQRESITAVDLRLATFLRAHATPVGDRIGLGVSFVGSPTVMAVLGVGVAAVLAYKRWGVSLSGWIAAFVGGGGLDWALKRIVHRERPLGAKDFLYGTSFSFPSGHAMGSLIGYGMLAYLLIAFWPPARRHRRVVAIAAAVTVLLIGLSRLYLGVHFLSDVIAGFAAGSVWLAVCITGVDIALRQRGLEPWEAGLGGRRYPHKMQST